MDQERHMGETLTIRITAAAGEIHDLRYRFIWSVRLGSRLLGHGHAFDPQEAETKAMDLVTDLLTPEEVDHTDIIVR
jgi:hypothetical protein